MASSGGASSGGPAPSARAPQGPASPHRRGGRSRWRTALRFLFRSLSLRGPTFLLALLAITVGATLSATMLDIRADLGAKMSRELRRYGPNLLLMPPSDARGATEAAPTLSEADLPRARAAIESAGLVTGGAISPLLLATGTIGAKRTRAGASPATIMGVDFAALRGLYPSWRLSGAWPAAGDRACVLGASLAQRTGLAPGGTAIVAVRGVVGGVSSLEVAGVVSTGESEDDALFVPLALLQEETGMTGRVSLAALSVDGGVESVSRAASAASVALGGAIARPLRQVAASQGVILGKVGRMMLLLTIVVMALSGLCLVTTLMTSVVERENEIGLMRSIGAADIEIVAMFVGEVLLLGLFGGAVGTVLGALCARLIGTRMFDATIEPRAEVAPLVLAISVVLCLVSVLVPLRRALAIAPAAALRGE